MLTGKDDGETCGVLHYIPFTYRLIQSHLKLRAPSASAEIDAQSFPWTLPAQAFQIGSRLFRDPNHEEPSRAIVSHVIYPHRYLVNKKSERLVRQTKAPAPRRPVT